MRFWVVCALALMFAADATFPTRAAEANKVGAPGDSYVVELEGNPSTGYRWKLSEPSSENLGILRVDDLGYRAAKKEPGRVLVGAPRPYEFRITLLSPGAAKLLFEYLRPWESKPIKTFEQRIDVRGR